MGLERAGKEASIVEILERLAAMFAIGSIFAFIKVLSDGADHLYRFGGESGVIVMKGSSILALSPVVLLVSIAVWAWARDY